MTLLEIIFTSVVISLFLGFIIAVLFIVLEHL